MLWAKSIPVANTLPFFIDYDRALAAVADAAQKRDFSEIEARLRRISQSVPAHLTASQVRRLAVRQFDRMLQEKFGDQAPPMSQVFERREEPFFELVHNAYAESTDTPFSAAVEAIDRSITVDSKVRRGESFMFRGDRPIYYVAPGDIANRCREIDGLVTRCSSIADCIILFKAVLMCHPLTDGNGRLARSIFDISICRVLDVGRGLSTIYLIMQTKRSLLSIYYSQIYFDYNSEGLMEFLFESLITLSSLLEQIFFTNMGGQNE